MDPSTLWGLPRRPFCSWSHRAVCALSPAWGMTRQLPAGTSSTRQPGITRRARRLLARSPSGLVRIIRASCADPAAASVVIFFWSSSSFQYWFHRLSHRWTAIGALWNAHRPSPAGSIYVVMHGVFHPVNALISALLLQSCLLLLGSVTAGGVCRHADHRSGRR